MTVPYTPPTFNEKAFNCPYCHAFAKQGWATLNAAGALIDDLRVSACSHCWKRAVWHEGRLVIPASTTAPPPNADLPDDVRGDYL